MNSKLNLMLLIVISLFLAALISRDGTLILLAIPFLIFMAVGLWLSPRDVQLRAARALSSLRSDGKKPIKMALMIENSGTSIPCLQIEEPVLPNMSLAEGELQYRFFVSPGEKIRFHYSFQASRGYYSWQNVKLKASDPFDLFEKSFELKAEAHALVYPELEKVQRFNYHPRPTVRTSGPYLSRAAGSGIDFWGVREYHTGDALRLIDWRKTARNPGYLYSKEFEREEMADIGLLLDARMITNNFSSGSNLFEHSIQAAATLAKYFLSSGNRVSMLVLSDRLVRVFPGYGKRQLTRVLDQLAGCSLGESITLESLKYLPVKLFPSHSVIVLISPLCSGDFPVIARLQAEGYQLLVLSPDPAIKNPPDQFKNSIDALAVRTVNLERAVLMHRLRQIGVRVIDWNTDHPLLHTLRSARFYKM
jgi:uncharacterized protein (DUF58 family)